MTPARAGSARAVVVRGPRQMGLEQRPRPTPGPEQVLVRVRYSACCATDFDLIDGTMPDQARYPIVLGHEWSGEVVTAPAGFESLVGRPVVADNLVTCGACPACLRGRPNLCVRMDELGFSLDGAHADYLVTLARSVHVLPPGVALRAAALIEPLGVALYGTWRARVGLGDRVLILGAGPIGLLALQTCRAAGAREVWQADLRPERRALAERLGAAGTLDVAREELTAALARTGVAPDVVLECSGSPAAFAAALRAVRAGGRVGVLGYYSDGRVEIRPSDIMMRDLEVIGAVCPTGTWAAAIELLATGRVDTEALITHVLPLERFEEAYRLARGGPGVVKVVLEI